MAIRRKKYGDKVFFHVEGDNLLCSTFKGAKRKEKAIKDDVKRDKIRRKKLLMSYYMTL